MMGAPDQVASWAAHRSVGSGARFNCPQAPEKPPRAGDSSPPVPVQTCHRPESRGPGRFRSRRRTGMLRRHRRLDRGRSRGCRSHARTSPGPVERSSRRGCGRRVRRARSCRGRPPDRPPDAVESGRCGGEKDQLRDALRSGAAQSVSEKNTSTSPRSITSVPRPSTDKPHRWARAK
jgi:hypothetical protein